MGSPLAERDGRREVAPALVFGGLKKEKIDPIWRRRADIDPIRRLGRDGDGPPRTVARSCSVTLFCKKFCRTAVTVATRVACSSRSLLSLFEISVESEFRPGRGGRFPWRRWPRRRMNFDATDRDSHDRRLVLDSLGKVRESAGTAGRSEGWGIADRGWLFPRLTNAFAAAD